MMDIVEEINRLQLDILDEDWIQGIYYSEFLEFGEFPAEYESVLESLDVRSVFRSIMTAIDRWLDSDDTTEEKSWASLCHHIKHKGLLAILAYYIDYGTKNVFTKEYRNTALFASRVYYKLLAVPGYKAYHIYHSQLFAHSLSCLSFPKAVCDNEDRYYNTKELTREVNSIIKELQPLVVDLRSIIETLQLNPSDMNFEDILSNLVDITGGAIVNKLNVDKIELVNISGIIYNMINILICDSDGEPNPVAIRLLFKCLLPKLIAASIDSKNANNLVRASYVTYSGLLLTRYGKAALPGYTVLLEHLCYTQDGLERAEVRGARVSLVVGLMSLLPRKSYRSFVKWILKLSTTAKIPHRHIALEILSKLLSNDPEEAKPSEKPSEPEQAEIASDQQQPAVTATEHTETSSDPQAVSATNQMQQPTEILLESQAATSVANETLQPTENPSDKQQTSAESAIEQIDQTETALDQTKNGTDQTANTSDKIQEHTDASTNQSQQENEMNQTSQTDTVADKLVQLQEIEATVDEPMNALDEIGMDIAHEPLQEIEKILGETTTGNMDHLRMDITDELLLQEIENALQEPLPPTENNTDQLFMEITDLQPLDVNMTEVPQKDTSDVQSTNTNPGAQNVEKNDESFQGQNENEKQTPDSNPPKEVPVSEDDNSQEPPGSTVATIDTETDVTEDDLAGLLRQRAHTVPHAELLRAVYERTNDVSSTLRARALALLTEFVASDYPPMQQAIKELNGSASVSRLMAIAARSVCDERAAVRRAALALVHRLLSAPGAPDPQPTDLGILVGLCRDASILVRSSAITVLGELVRQRSTSATFDAFLTGPMHQLSDPETKIQEQVVTLIEQLLFDRLRKYSEVACEDQLPWMFLASVTRHNMRRHLQKACTILAKTGNCINHRLIDIVSTHLGALGDARDLHALVLLTSAARLVDYSDISFVLEYYYKLADDPQPRDVRLLPLTLELATVWARYARTADRTALRDHLVRRLAAANDDGCRLACATLAAHLDPHNLTWATEMMQLSERHALSGTDVSEWLRAADLSLVAPVPPSPALLRLFLNSLSNPPAEWSRTEAEYARFRGESVAGCGRLCVRSRDAAAAAAPALAALLQDATAPLPARINSLLAITDICTRYTCIVDPLLGCVCGCLSPGTAAPLRRATARALTRLLLAGYLRLRTPLYYRYCALLADEDHDVREPAEYYVTCCLTPDAIYHHFVDCVLHYNDEKSETISFDARQLIYDVMLQRLSIVQKLNVQCRLAREVLEHAADVTDEGDGELPAGLNAALLDTITLLCGPRMKLPKKPQRDGDAADIDDLQERVTTNIVSHKMKRTVAEVLVPAVLRLYSRIGSRGGQVAAYLVRIANDLLIDYRQEIEELIENDEELVERVRQFQETIGLEPSFGNARNLVTASTAHEPDTPRAPRRRAPRTPRGPRGSPRKRALRI